MRQIVIDASVAVKWVVAEEDTPAALALRKGALLAAPDLLTAECANILWKKVQRGELLPDEALVAARLLQHSDIEIWPMRQLLEQATRMAIALDHPAYDCIYLALASTRDSRFVTADDHLLRKLRRHASPSLGGIALSLSEAAAELDAAPPRGGRRPKRK